MRTTLTLDPDVARMVEEEVHRLHKPFKQVVNDALRRGLGPRMAGGTPARYRVKPHESKLRPGVDLSRLNALVDELAVDVLEAPRPARRRRARAS